MENYIRFINYKKTTGEILSIETRPNGFPPENPDIGYIEFSNGTKQIYKNYYIVNDTLTERPQINSPDELILKVDDVYIFENIPDNTKINIFDIEEEITDGTFEISFPVSGIFELKFDPPFPYFQKNVTIIVEDK